MKHYVFFSILLVALSFAACSSDTPTTPQISSSPYLKIGEATTAGTTVELFAADSLISGYNKLYIKLTTVATNAIVRDAHLELTPIMDMGSMIHSCPVEQSENAQITGDYFECASVFTMPSVSGGQWKIKIDLHNHVTDKEGSVEIPVQVKEAHCCKVLNGSDGNSYVVTISNFKSFKVGMNDIDITVHRRDNSMSYPVVDNLTLQMTPDMPSMGHGSPNNVHPSYTANGHYKGKVNFTMTGEWRITVQLNANNTLLGKPEFMVTL